MRIVYRQAASNDLIRQFRYYLVAQNVPEVADRFLDAVCRTLELLRQNPFMGSRYQRSSPQLENLRSWPVAGFEAIRIYYLPEADLLQVVRILHGKRDVKAILVREQSS